MPMNDYSLGIHLGKSLHCKVDLGFCGTLKCRPFNGSGALLWHVFVLHDDKPMGQYICLHAQLQVPNDSYAIQSAKSIM